MVLMVNLISLSLAFFYYQKHDDHIIGRKINARILKGRCGRRERRNEGYIHLGFILCIHLIK
jgi:hypothetical protein